MGFDKSKNRGQVNPKYRTKEHRAYRESLVREIRRDGFVLCTARVCVMDSRKITEPDGRPPYGLHAGHNDAGDEYDGPQHNACNSRDGALRGRARQEEGKQPMRLTPGIARPVK